MLSAFHKRTRGFSLVELLVALVFTGVLMSGLAAVFKSSLGSFRSEGEKLSSLRRNRLALEILRDDLDGAGQTLGNISFHTTNVNQSYPLFAIYPDGDTARPADEQRDWIQFFYEESLPFEGRLYNNTGSATAMMVNESLDAKTASGLAVKPTDAASRVIQINFRNQEFRDAFVAAVEAYKKSPSPIHAVYKDNYRLLALAGATPLDDTACTVETTGTEDQESGGGNLSVIYGLSNYTAREGDTSYTGSNPGAPITLIRPRLLVRYSIDDVELDPSKPGAKVPCLVKRTTAYDSANDVADPGMANWARQIIAEDVVGLKVSLSMDSGVTWITGETNDSNATASARSSAWSAFKGRIDAKLGEIEDPLRFKHASNDSWFRYFPMLVRLDLTSRNAVARVTTGGSLAPTYTKNTRVVVAMPRYSGMPLTSTM